MTTSTPVEQLPIIDVPITALIDDDLNVRKCDPTEAGIEALAASIKAKGLLQNIVVRKKPRKKFGVVAGSRRSKALRLLVERGDLAKTDTVSCRLAPDELATEISLAENTQREDMHVADEIEAWGALSKGGMEVTEIAGRHGVTEAVVKKRLALGALSPVLIAALRANEFDLSTAMAFTLTADHTEQETVYTGLKETHHEIRSHQVRSAITKSEVPSHQKLARFVGQEAYEAAGGIVRTDLFEETSYFADRALLTKLAEAKIEAEEQRLLEAGWLWVEFQEQFYSWEMGQKMRRVYPAIAPLSEEDDAKVTELTEKLEALVDDDLAESEEAVQLEEDIALIRGTESYAETDIMIGGGWFTVGNDGEFEHHLGFIRKSDDPRHKKLGKDGSATAGKPAYGKSLCDDVAHVYWTILRAEFMANPETAAALLEFEIIRAYHKGSHVFKISARDPDGRRIYSDAGMLGSFVGRDTYEAAIADVPLGWIEEDDTAKAFDTFRKLSPENKTRALAFVAANTLEAVLPAEAAGAGGLDHAAKLMKTNVRAYWTPNADFFARLRKSELLEIGKKIIGASWSEARKKEKKSDLVLSLAGIFDGSCASLTATAKKRAAAWVPAPMRLTAKPKSGSSSPS